MGDDGLQLAQVAQHAPDLDASVAFYREVLGLPFLARFDPPGLAFFRLGDVRLLLEAGPPPALLYLRVDDIEERYQQLRAAGVSFVDEPRLIHRDDDGLFGRPGMEEWMAFFRDPAGNLLGLAARR